MDSGLVAEWIAAVGTAGGFITAAAVYFGSMRDRRRAQARLLAVVGWAEIRDLHVESPHSIPLDSNTVSIGVLLEADDVGYGVEYLSLTDPATRVSVHLVSTSDEPFFIHAVDILSESGELREFLLNDRVMGPRADWVRHNLVPLGSITGRWRVRVLFQDSAGRYWVRETGEPVRQMSRRERRQLPNRDQHVVHKVEEG